METTGLLLVKRVFNKLGRPLGVNPFPRAFPNPLTDGTACRTEAFDRVYTNNFWGSSQSRSGLGSEKDFTAPYAEALAKMVHDRRFRRILDAPCGDLNWMADLVKKHGWDYRGGDVSALVVKQVQERHPGLAVQTFDICESPFPDADVWHCRDCLFHLPFADIRKVFANFSRSRIPYALLTTHRARLLHRNLDVSIGGFRYLDLQRAPFNLPAAEEYLADYKLGVDFPRYVGLWSRQAVTIALESWHA